MKKVLLATALAVMGGSAWAATSEFTCPEGSASTLHCFTCGSNCTMTLDTATGHAVVSGTGEMETARGNIVDGNTNAWGKYSPSFKSLEIKTGITSIGYGAFRNTSVETVTIPNTVTRIGTSAFYDAIKLQNVVIPDSVTTIETYTFAGTQVLKELIIPDSVTAFGSGVFYGAGIQNLTIPDNLVIQKNACAPGVITCSYFSRTFDSVSLQNVTCAGGGDTAKCDALLKQGGKNIQSTSRPNYRLDENGNVVERYQYDENGNRKGYTLDGRIYEYDKDGNWLKSYIKNADGSTYIYNKDGNLVGIKGKKIYTVEEAEAVTAHGDRFHVSLTYK